MDSASLVLGILGVFLWPMPLAGFIVGAAAFSFGALVLRRGRSALAVAGIILAGIAVVAALVSWRMGLLDLILRSYFQD